MNAPPRRAVALLFITVTLLLAMACGPAAAPPQEEPAYNPGAYPGGSEVTAPGSYGGQYGQSMATGDTEAGAAFARWVVDQDPQQQYITGAVVRNEQTLGIKVQPNVRKGDLQQLMVSLTEGMARTFPDRPVTVIAFYQSGDKLAESSYDPSTGNVAVRFT